MMLSIARHVRQNARDGAKGGAQHNKRERSESQSAFAGAPLFHIFV